MSGKRSSDLVSRPIGGSRSSAPDRSDAPLAVSCSVTRWLSELARRADLAADVWLRDLPIRLEHLRNPERRIDWDLFASLCDRLERRLGGRERACELARELAAEHVADAAARLTGGFDDERQLYWLARHWIGPSLLPGLVGELEVLADGRLRQAVELPADARSCPLLLALIPCALEVVPGLIGRPPARVHSELSASARGAVYTIEPAGPAPEAGHESPAGAHPDDRARSHRMEAIGRLAGGIAHDFNNLLTAITGYCDLLLEGLGPEHPLRADAKEIQRAADRATRLTRQLLTFNRRQLRRPQVLDLNAAISEVDRLLRGLMGAEVELVTRLDAESPQVEMDPGHIEQLVVNLAVNARDAMPSGGLLTVRTGEVEVASESEARRAGVETGRYVSVSVRDTGVGMDATTASRIFEPFFSTRDGEKGTGLGLAIVRDIVQQSGGGIRVDTAPGDGSTFTVLLPRAEAEPELAGEPLERSGPLRGAETILLVEDALPVRRMAARHLERHGYTVLCGGTPGEALRRARRHDAKIDLLVSDVVLPQMSGPALARRLQQQRPALRVLYVSGFPDDVLADHGLSPADAALLRKPFSPAELLRRTRAVLES